MNHDFGIEFHNQNFSIHILLFLENFQLKRVKLISKRFINNVLFTMRILHYFIENNENSVYKNLLKHSNYERLLLQRTNGHFL